MYSLDINFVRDRPEYNSKTGTQSSNLRLPFGNISPLYLGIATGVLLPALVGIGWLIIQTQNTRLEQEIAQLDAELSRLGIQEQEIQRTQAEITRIQADTQALATVFNQIRPWSAMLQDLRDRIPTTVQIESIKQTAVALPSPSPSPSPSPPPSPGASPSPSPSPGQPAAAGQPAPNPGGGIEITGIARSFNDVNDFLLTLQQSAFLNPADTRIVTAELVEAIATPGSSGQTAPIVVRGPQVVRYTIQSSLSDVPASDLLRELERKGTLGLVTRIRLLQQRGVIQQ